MEACIISIAQQASPKVIHMSEPVRAQLISSSAVVSKKPLSASSSENRPKLVAPGVIRPPDFPSFSKLGSGINPIRARLSATHRSQRWERRGTPSSPKRNKRFSDFLHPRNERISSEVGTSKEKGRPPRR